MDVKRSEWLAATYLPLRVAMLKCEHCASHNVRWFTPRSYADRAAVLLCMTCRRLTISTARSVEPVETSKAA